MLSMNNANIKKQSGAVLVMALVMLAVLTLIGVASMDSSSMELKIASNTQEHDVAFQAAQSIIAFVISDDPARELVINYQNISDATQEITYLGPNTTFSPSENNVVVTHVGCSAGIGDSLEEGKGQKYNFYDAKVTGYNVRGSSNSVQIQGVRYFAAGCG